MCENRCLVHFRIRRNRTLFPYVVEQFFVKLRYFPINPRPAGVWLVTRPAGGGGGKGPPEISQTTAPISKFQTSLGYDFAFVPTCAKTLYLCLTSTYQIYKYLSKKKMPITISE